MISICMGFGISLGGMQSFFATLGTSGEVTLLVAVVVSTIVLWRVGVFSGLGSLIINRLFRDRSAEAANKNELRGWFNRKDESEYKVGKWFGKE